MQIHAASPSSAGSAAGKDRRARLVKTYAYYLAFIMLGLVAAVIGPTLNGLSRHTGSTIDQISYVFVLRSLGYLGGSLLAGRLYDRGKGHPLMSWAVLALAAAVFFVPLASVLWVLALLVLIVGLAQGLVDVGGNTLLIWVHREEMKVFMNGLHFFFGLGALLSPIIVGVVLITTRDIHWAYWLLAILMLPGAAWLSRLPSPVPLVSAETQPTRPAIPLLIGMIAFFMFVYVGVEIGYGGYVSKYALEKGLASDAGSAFLASGFWGAMTAGRLLGIPLSARFSPQKILLVDLLVVLVGLAVVFALPGSITALWAGTILTGLGMASIFPTVLILAEEHMTITGFVTSWFFVGSSLGGMSLPWLIGQLFARIGPQAVMPVILAGILCALALFALVMFYTGRLIRRRQGIT